MMNRSQPSDPTPGSPEGEKRSAEPLSPNEAFLSLGQLLNATTTPEAAARVVLEVSDRLFHWDACWLELLDPSGPLPRMVLLMDEIEGERREVPSPYPDLRTNLLSRRVREKGPLLVLRTPEDMSQYRLPFGDVSRPSASILCVPIRSGELFIGAVSIQSYRFNAYDEGDLKIFQALADYCAGALQRTQAEAARHLLQEQLMQAQRAEAEALREQARLATIRDEIGAALAAGGDLPTVLEQALRPLAAHLPVAFARVWTLAPGEDVLRMQATAGIPPPVGEPRRLIRVGEMEIGVMVAEQRPVLEDDLRRHPIHAPWAAATGITGLAAFPLVAEGRAVGALAVFAYDPIPAPVVGTLEVMAERLARFVDRAQAQQALSEMQARFSAYMEHIPAQAVMRDEAGRYVYVNRQFEQTHGLRFEDVRGKTVPEVFPSHIAELFLENERAMLAQDRPMEFTEVVTLADGRTQEVLAVKFPIRDSLGRRYVGVISTDLTERRVLEEQLRQAQKMEAVGRLAGGVAHDFNNMLGVINGYAELLLADPEFPARYREPIGEMLKAGERAAALTRQLLAFSRKQIIQPRVLVPGEVVAELETMLRRVIGEDIVLVTRLGDGGAQVRVDPSQLHQVLLNLAVNARDAMPQGGLLTVETAAVDLTTLPGGEEETFRPGPYVCLTVTDTGTGIDAAALPHVFEPFFTTKPVGAGSGLGLATVYGIVKQSGGHVRVESEPGQGATFRIYLPRIDEEAGN